MIQEKSDKREHINIFDRDYEDIADSIKEID